MSAPENRRTIRSWLLAVSLMGLTASSSISQEGWAGKNLSFQRTVQVGGTGNPAVVVVEFFTHGELHADGKNLAVYEGSRLVPWKILQRGPGDYCRLAFQTVRTARVYQVYYGGPGPAEKSPPWGHTPGLLLETRHFRPCNLNNPEALRRALALAEPIGADFVPTVSHRYNPFAPDPAPFLSRYHGRLTIEIGGQYQFFTSSQDCSFLFIDGQLVVAAPGRHPPAYRARFKGAIHLTAGDHEFEYLHAAAGPEACMVAAWQTPRGGQPVAIPPSFFGAHRVTSLSTTGLQHKEKGYLPDFTAAVEGDAPVLESDLPLVRVRFMDSSPKIVSSRAKVQWDFGDGQTAETLDVNHVYLRPGLYTVKLTVQNSAQTLRISNRFHVHRALVLEGKKPDQLADYLRILDRYEVLKLDPAAIVQLLRVYEQLNRLDRAGQAGKAALLAAWKEPDEEALVELARLVGPLLRDRLGDPGGAAAAWQGAASLLRQGRLKADCELEAADIFINDVLQHAPAEGLLKAAATRVGQNDHSPQGLRLQRLWGDWYARANQRSEARAAYARAAAGQGGGKSIVEQNAWRGAFSRSTEAFLRDKEWNRALEELRRWQEQFPGDKVEGYLPLLQARYWEARGQYAQAIAVANDLCNLNPDSPYADRLAFLAAECDEKQGRRDRAQAAFKSFLTDYPGSPLVGEVRKKLAQLSLPPDKVTKKPKPTQPPQPPDKVKIPSRPPRKP